MKEEQKAAHIVHAAAVAAERTAQRMMVEGVASTEPGKEFLKFLHRICGYSETNLVLNRTTGEIDTVASTFNEVRRGVYLQIRPLIPTEVLREIENPFPITKTEETK